MKRECVLISVNFKKNIKNKEEGLMNPKSLVVTVKPKVFGALMSDISALATPMAYNTLIHDVTLYCGVCGNLQNQKYHTFVKFVRCNRRKLPLLMYTFGPCPRRYASALMRVFNETGDFAYWRASVKTAQKVKPLKGGYVEWMDQTNCNRLIQP